MPEMADKLLTEQLEWYRLERHDFLNHLQVIMGYLQLKQADKAHMYIKETLNGLASEQQTGQIPEPVVAAILLGLMIRLRLLGIPSSIKLVEECKRIAFWSDYWQKKYGEMLYGYTTECLDLANSRFPADNLFAEIEVGVSGDEVRFWFKLFEDKAAVDEKVFKLPKELPKE